MSLNTGIVFPQKISVNIFTDLSTRITSYIRSYIPGFTLRRASTSIAVIIAAKIIIQAVQTRILHRRFLEQAQRKRINRDNQILNGFIPTIEISEEANSIILSSTATRLMQLLNEGKITSELILKAYHNRAIRIGLRLELIAESNFTEALSIARQCDIQREKTPIEERSKLGSMFGLPICIKDSIQQKGFASSAGLARYCNVIYEEDGATIKLLRAQGAIPFVRTNCTQALALSDNTNHIWGRAINPWRDDRSTGGSSGGDAGLVASRCSPIGIGTDYYGSIRIPASFCGIYGFKPTSGRTASFGDTEVVAQDLFKQLFLQATAGPIATCVDDLALVLRGMITPENKVHDPSSPLIPWREEIFQSKQCLRVGYILTEDLFSAARPCRRAVQEAVNSLKRAGHEVVELRIPNFNTMALYVLRILFCEGQAQRHVDALGGEMAIDELGLIIKISRLPNFVKRSIRPFMGKRLQVIWDCTLESSAKELFITIAKALELRAQFLKFWSEWRLDAIITPATQLPALKHGYGGSLQVSGYYAWLGNFANLPAGVVPVTKVLPGEDTYTHEDSIYVGDTIFKASQECMKGSVGLPVAVQVLAPPWEDEKCLAVMKAIENEIQFYELPIQN